MQRVVLGKWAHILLGCHCKTLVDMVPGEGGCWCFRGITLAKEAKTSCFFVFITRHLTSIVRVGTSGRHLQFDFARDTCEWNETLEEFCHCLEDSLSAVCGSKWLMGILEHSRLLLVIYIYLFCCYVSIPDFRLSKICHRSNNVVWDMRGAF